MLGSAGATCGANLLFCLWEGTTPKKDTVYVRGVWEREKGSGVWWIRYRAEGVLRREKGSLHRESMSTTLQR
jgi:hypothetical protein